MSYKHLKMNESSFLNVDYIEPSSIMHISKKEMQICNIFTPSYIFQQIYKGAVQCFNLLFQRCTTTFFWRNDALIFKLKLNRTKTVIPHI